MYIGPWQEYRLAKIQDDAIQRLRHEWEAQLRGQLPATEHDRISELMQPLVARLPSLLQEAKAKAARPPAARRQGRPDSSSQCSTRPPSARSVTSSHSNAASTSSLRALGAAGARQWKPNGLGNQETHDENASRSLVSRTKSKPLLLSKKKKKKAPQLTALEAVQKRKRMFATWIKHADNGSDADATASSNTTAIHNASQPSEGPTLPVQAREALQRGVNSASDVTRLPPIYPVAPANASSLLGTSSAVPASVSWGLPQIGPRCEMFENQQDSPSLLEERAPLSAPSCGPCSVDLDEESLDEEEVNNLLSWTDTLLSPQAMDSFGDLDV